jgi:hypothetical protein
MENVVVTFDPKFIEAVGEQVEFSTKAQAGRPVDPNSARQQRLAQAPGKRTGRKINPESARQKRLAEMEARKEANNGEVKRGRPANSDSARQKAIAERQALLDAGIVIKRGRPKASAVETVEEAKVEPVATEKPVSEKKGRSRKA